MPSITIQGEEFGRLAGEAIETILEKANTNAEFNRLVAAFQVFMEATDAFTKQEEGSAAASVFVQAARQAFDARLAELDSLAEQSTRPHPVRFEGGEGRTLD